MRKLLVSVVLVVLLGGLAALSLGAVASSAVERGGTYALGVETEVDDVELGLLSGRFGLRGLRVANPKGFDEPHLLVLDDAHLSIGLASLTADTVEVPRLVVDGLDLTLERSGDGLNVTPVMESLERFGGPDEPAPDDPAEEGKRFVVRELRIEGVTARLALAPELGSLGTTRVELTRLVLEDVGAGGGGQSLPELVATILTAVLDALAGQGALPDEFQARLDAGLGQLDALRGRLEVELSELQRQAGEVGEQVEQAKKDVEDVGKQVEGALEGLLGGGKKGEEKDGGGD